MTLDKIILKDFLSYSKFEYSFEKRPLMIQGLNLTDDGQKSNGSGKSALQTAIEMCITSSNSRDVGNAEIITYGKKSSVVQLYASCDIRKENIHIKWTLNLKGSNTLELKIKKYNEEWEEDLADGTNKHSLSFSNVNDGKKKILDWFAISKEDLFSYYIINSTRFKSFFKSSNREKVDLINRFSDASIIKGLEEIDNSDLNSELTAAQKLVDSSEGGIEVLKGQILTQSTRNFAEELAEERSEIEEEIEEEKRLVSIVEKDILIKKEEILDIEKEILEEKSSLDTLAEDRADIEKEIAEITIKVTEAKESLIEANNTVISLITTDWNKERKELEEDIESDEETIEEAEEKQAELSSQNTKLLKFIQDIEIKLSGKITCPNCSHEFLLDKDGDSLEILATKREKADAIKKTLEVNQAANRAAISILKENIRSLESNISGINKKEEIENAGKNVHITALNSATRALNTIESKQKELERELKACDSDEIGYKRTIKSLEESIKNTKEKIENFTASIKNHNKQIKIYKDDISALETGNNKSLLLQLEKDLKVLEKRMEGYNLDLITVGNKIYERNQWITNFKQFRMFLANQSLDIIEYHMNRYLEGMGSDMRIKLEGFRLLADGTPKEEITASVIRENERSFSSFSKGEQGRLLFASILANRHMINETHPYGGLDFLSIDEIFEGVDALGFKSLLESAKKLDIPVMIVSHVTVDDIESDSITIVKENGISNLKID